jgi:hypothetical protein
MDAREFIRMLAKENTQYSQVVMNLPAAGPEFLGSFKFKIHG